MPRGAGAVDAAGAGAGLGPGSRTLGARSSWCSRPTTGSSKVCLPLARRPPAPCEPCCPNPPACSGAHRPTRARRRRVGRGRRRIAARGCAAVRGWPGNVRPCPPAFLREPRRRASARVTTDPRAGGAGVSGEAAAGALLVSARRHQSDGEKRVRGPRGVFVVTQWCCVCGPLCFGSCGVG